MSMEISSNYKDYKNEYLDRAQEWQHSAMLSQYAVSTIIST